MRTPDGHYHLRQELGRGTFGKVFLADEERHDERQGTVTREVAIKIFHRFKGVDEEVQEEYDLLLAARHPNVIPVLRRLPKVVDVRTSTSGQWDAKCGPALVFAAADTDLCSFLRRHGAPEAASAATWAAEVGTAIEHCHALGIVHRDVKPANILLVMRGGGGMPGGFIRLTAMLADFGTARRMPEAGQPPRPRRHREKTTVPEAPDPLSAQPAMSPLVCTAWYRAPELIVWTMTPAAVDVRCHDARGVPKLVPYGRAVDVWSFGCVVGELLRGAPLISAATGAGVVAALCQTIGHPGDPHADGAPAYMLSKFWQDLLRHATSAPSTTTPIPDTQPWGVVRACLRWQPQERPHMKDVLASWFPVAETKPCPGHDGASAGASTPAAGLQEDAHPRDVGRGAPTPATVGRSLLRTEELGPENEREVGTKQCKCKGHCRIAKHRREGSCESAELVKGMDYCADCICKVPGCPKPRHKHWLCFRHLKCYSDCPPGLQYAIAAAPLASVSVPEDVLDFCGHWSYASKDFALALVLALFKDPNATAACVAAHKDFPPDHGAEAFGQCVLAGVKASRASWQEEGSPMPSLSRQGVARVLGVAPVGIALGVITATAEGELALGATMRRYDIVDEPARHKRLEAFLAAARGGDGTPPCLDAGATPAQIRETIRSYATRLRRLLQAVTKTAPRLGAGENSNYVADFVVRKCVLAVTMSAKLPLDFWRNVPMRQVAEWTADSHNHMAAMPKEWSAAEVSAMVCGREDWPLLASTFACLWTEVAQSSCFDAEKGPRVVEGSLNQLIEVQKASRCAKHPTLLLRAAGLLNEQPAARPKRKRGQ